MGEQVPWPAPPRHAGPWEDGASIAPEGNTALPPLPDASGTMATSTPHNPWQRALPAADDSGLPVAPASFQLAPLAPVGHEKSAKKPKSDRAPIGLRLLAAFVVLAMAGSGTYLVLKGGRQFPSTWDPRVVDIAKWVEGERGLQFKHAVKVNFLSAELYRERATAGNDISDPDTKAHFENSAAQMRALGFISGEVDLAAASSTLSDSGTLAFYDPAVEQVFVRGTEVTAALRVTLAHELVHVLQDQHFDLERMDEMEDGRAAVLRSLAEGDAGRVEDAYVAKALNDKERAAYEAEMLKSSQEALEEVNEKVPPILTTVFTAPYALGPQLVDVLYETGGNKAINAALKDPPSEEALFDPRTLDTDALDERLATVEPPKEVEVIDGGEFGPTTWYLMLASRMDPHIALDATDGWGGDAYSAYRQNDKVCVSVVYRGDTPADAKTLLGALQLWVAASPEGSASVEGEGARVNFRSCDPGKDAKGSSGNNGDGDVSPDLLSLPVVRTQIYLQGLQADLESDIAACYAQEVVGAFTFEQLIDPSGSAIGSPDGQSKLAGAAMTCRN